MGTGLLGVMSNSCLTSEISLLFCNSINPANANSSSFVNDLVLGGGFVYGALCAERELRFCLRSNACCFFLSVSSFFFLAKYSSAV